MARAVPSRVEEKPRVDPDATAQLERPPAEAKAAPAPSRPTAVRRPADRWSTVFTVFAAVALVALLLLGAAVISSQQVAAPSASRPPSPSPSASASPTISATPVPRTATPTEAPTLTPVPTRTLPLTPVPTPSAPLTPVPTRT